MRRRAAQAGRSSASAAAGKADPRWDRNARAGAAALDYGASLDLDAQGRLVVKPARAVADVSSGDEVADRFNELLRCLREAGILEK